MRAIYAQTFTFVDATTGALKPLNGASVTVYNAGTVVKPPIYTSRDPGNATQVSNPITLGANGYAEFWIPAGEYDILVHDNNAPARVSDKTYGFNAVPSGAGSIPSALVAGDGGLGITSFGASALRQVKQIGEAMLWWRPSNLVPLPSGYEICDGRTIIKANHDFAEIAGSINLPDMRNKFPMGANSSNADGAAAVAGSDAAASAPGIGGAGGSNVRNLSHTHDLSNHTHDHAHTHGMDHVHTHAHTHDLSNHTHSLANHTHPVPGHGHGTGALAISAGGDHDHLVSNWWPPDSGPGGAPVYWAEGGTAQWALPGPIGFHSPVRTGIASGRTFGGGNHAHSVSGSVGNFGVLNGDNSMTSGTPSTANSGTPSSNVTGAVSADNSSSPRTVGGAARLSTDGASTNTSGVPSNNTSGTALSATQDIKPQAIGFLFLMKVRRS